jgi:hypothetical protein
MGVFPKELTNLICFFPGSLNGLNVGGAVKLRGVGIGLVSEIRLQPLPFEAGLTRQTKPFPELSVVIDIDESQLVAHGATGAALKSQELASLIQHGFRAQLDTENP